MRVLQAMTAALLMLCLGTASASALDFPPLTGRVVDQAGILNSDIRGDLADKLKDLEEKSGIQLVVATVTSLQGSDIETYANELFRTWKLGQAQKNNGVLLLVAPNERKVRIEVGYGLEGTLTDAVASVIISSAIVPRFKNGDFPGGIERGVGGILDVLGGDTADWQPQAVVREDNRSFLWALFPLFGSIGLLIVVRLFAIGIRRLYLGRRYGDWHPAPAGHYVKRGKHLVFVSDSGWSSSSSGSSWSSSSSSSSSSDSDFSGGGGSSGGGGASGSW
ncbi:MAG: TPM domain-containing protein [Xanthobacteraceae bacterium]